MTSNTIISPLPQLTSSDYWKYISTLLQSYSGLPDQHLDSTNFTIINRLREFQDAYYSTGAGPEVFITVCKSRKPIVRYTIGDTYGVVITTAALKMLLRSFSMLVLAEGRIASNYTRYEHFCLLDLIQYLHESDVGAIEMKYSRKVLLDTRLTQTSPPIILSNRYSDLDLTSHRGFVGVPPDSILHRSYGKYWQDAKCGSLEIMNIHLLFAEVSRYDL